MEDINLFAELFGLVATILMFVGFFNIDDKKLIVIGTFSNLFWAFHFLVLGAIGGFISILFSLSRTFIFFKFNTIKIKYTFLTVLSLFLFYKLYLNENLEDILPLISTFVVSYGILFYEKNKLTGVLILSNILWIIYSIIVLSISGTISYFIIILILLYRWIKINKAETCQN